MDGDKIKVYRKFSFGFIIVAIVVASLVTLITYIHQDRTSADPVVFWTVENHLTITIGLMIFSLVLGYGISSTTYRELRKSKKTSKSLLDTLFIFLNKEEREILTYLVKNKGQANQADISRLPEMNRVKAFRSLQKMKENNLIDVSAHGKIRKIALKENVRDILLNPEG